MELRWLLCVCHLRSKLHKWIAFGRRCSCPSPNDTRNTSGMSGSADDPSAGTLETQHLLTLGLPCVYCLVPHLSGYVFVPLVPHAEVCRKTLLFLFAIHIIYGLVKLFFPLWFRPHLPTQRVCLLDPLVFCELAGPFSPSVSGVWGAEYDTIFECTENVLKPNRFSRVKYISVCWF